MAKKQALKRFNWKFTVLLLLCLWLMASIFASSFSLFSSVDGGNVAVISITGPIFSQGDVGAFGSDVTSADNVLESIQQVKEDPFIKAVVFEVNSPGGSAVASKEIGDAVKRINKTTISLIREVGASGGYWVASATDNIVASPLSITGSIGVIASYLEFDGLFEEHGVNYRRLVAGELKDLASPFKNMSEREMAIMQQKLDAIHDHFIFEVAQNRNLSIEEVRDVATGAFFLGEEALSLRLIDTLGDKETVRTLLEEMIGEDVVFVEYTTRKSVIEQLLQGISSHGYSVGRGLGEGMSGMSMQQLDRLRVRT